MLRQQVYAGVEDTRYKFILRKKENNVSNTPQNVKPLYNIVKECINKTNTQSLPLNPSCIFPHPLPSDDRLHTHTQK